MSEQKRFLADQPMSDPDPMTLASLLWPDDVFYPEQEIRIINVWDAWNLAGNMMAAKIERDIIEAVQADEPAIVEAR